MIYDNSSLIVYPVSSLIARVLMFCHGVYSRFCTANLQTSSIRVLISILCFEIDVQ